MTKKATTKSKKTKTADDIAALTSIVTNLANTVGTIQNTVNANIGNQVVQAAVDEAVNTTVVQKDAVVEAVEAAEVALIQKIGESGQPMIHSTTDRRGYTRKTNITGVCLDMFDRIRKNRNQKNNMG
tara:strand:- start:149 stop:529 length:381 start_codon:yes stop_codon:yes gene_type:complete